MSLSSLKSGTVFGSPTNGVVGSKGGTLTPQEWAAIMILAGFPRDPKVIAEGLGTIYVESGFNSNPGGDGAHFGAWQEDSSFGSVADRLDPVKSTKGAKARWQADGKSFYPAWTRWQVEQSGRNGAQEGIKRYSGVAKEALSNIPSGGGGGGWIPGLPDPGDLIEAGEDVVGGITSAEDFLVELAKTVLDFRKLGQLMAEAVAWLLRLILKAIWDYVIAPLIHWAERAETFYWRNFFGTGVEKGSGVGYQLRQNAGIITIGFWALGYAILWSDGESLAPAESHNSMLGQTVKKIEGTIARRNLVKPENVEKETPTKPKPTSSTVQIEKTRELAVNRKRPVTVTGSGIESQTGRKPNERSGRVARPSQTAEGQKKKANKLIIPAGVKTNKKIDKQAQKIPAPNSDTGADSRANGSGIVEGSASRS